MVRAWYLDGEALNDPREEHHQFPPKFVTLEELYQCTGVEHHALNVETFKTDEYWIKLKDELGYAFEDELDTPDEETLKTYFTEHLHHKEEIRFVLEGCGYYDIRDNNDKWIRVEVVQGDLIVVPSGCYHRFMLDRSNKFKAKRLFIDNSKWSGVNRPADNLDCRQEYLNKLKKGMFTE